GSGSWSSLSDYASKTNFAAVDTKDVLARLAALPMQSWNYKTQGEGIRHLGPIAQDFHAAFGLGEDNRHIAIVDEGGVVLAAIQGLNQKVEEQRAELQRNQTEIADLRASLAELKASVRKLTTQNGGPK